MGVADDMLTQFGARGYCLRQIVSLLVLMLAVASGAWAAQPTTVVQLEQFLATLHGQSDGKVAKKLDGMTLTEQASPAQLARWEANLPGDRSREALTVLADASVLFLPPAASMLADPPPDAEAQRELLARANDYVVRTLTKLPDFSALRTTRRFEDSPRSNSAVPHPRFIGRSAFRVTYENGVESHTFESLEIPRGNNPGTDLETGGEFGPILSVVLGDSAQSSVKWGYWEMAPQGRLAVFKYSVPETSSDYHLAFTQGFRRVSVVPAYFGEIAIDPASGAILRISLLTSSMREQNVEQSAIAVYYRAVQLGGKDYICPVKGVAILISLVNKRQGGTGLQTQLNDTAFSAYHLLRGDIRILPPQP